MISRLTARFPTLTASLLYAVAVLLAFNRFFAGQVLLWEMSDQRGGYPARNFAAEYFREFGRIPEWSPYLFGGFPFVSNTGFGDTLFPTALLRMIMPVDQGMALGFIIFVFLAGVFAFLFLRSLRLSWGASFVGGAAFMFSGMVLSMPSPGHDGKLFVTAMLPLTLMFLYRATTQGDWRQYLYFGVTVGFCLLTPHFQAAYYLLMACGFFWAFMIFLSGEKAASETWWRAGLLFTAALVVGFALAAAQLLPFREYLPFSSRGENATWLTAISWSMPPEELLGAFFPGFNGTTVENYFGRNYFKLHSDYLGVVAAICALASFRLSTRKRLAWFFVFLAIYALLFGFGGHTPFYAIPYTILPGIAKTRAPSIIFFLVSMSAAVLAAFGAEYLLSRGSADSKAPKNSAAKNPVKAGSLLQQMDGRVVFGVATVVFVTLVAGVGGWRGLMDSLASSEGLMDRMSRIAAVDRNYAPFVKQMWLANFFALTAVILLLPTVIKKLGRETTALLLGVVVLADLLVVEHSYIRWSPRAAEIMPADEVVAVLKADTTLHRVVTLPSKAGRDPYGSNYLMGHRVRAALGYNSFEISAYDDLLGGKQGFPYITSPKLWQLIGVRYVVISNPAYCPVEGQPPEAQAQLGAFCATLAPVGDSLRSYDGGTATVYRVTNSLPYSFLVPVALRTDANAQQIAGTLVSPQFDARGLVILPKDAPVGVDSVSALGTPIANAVSAHEERPGKLHFQFERPAEADAFLYVAENYFPSWHATVDGAPVDIVRAQVAMMAVPVKAGAKGVDLEFSLKSYHLGLLISLGTLVAVLVVALLAWVEARRRATAV